jgi:hypothetical protein
MLDSQMESLLKQKQELEEEMDLYEEDDVQYVQAELDEVNEKISKLSKVDSFNIVDEMYSEDDDTPFLTNDIFES